MKARRFGITVVAVASVAAAVGAGVAQTGGSPDWLTALNARSEALNEEHRLGDHAQRLVLGAPGDGWREALIARSDAMNRHYGLGDYARQSARSSSTPDWVAALNARSDALNRLHGLGDYTAKRAPGARK